MKQQQQQKIPAVHHVSTARTEDGDDEEAVIQAAKHREQATNLVRDHLKNHVAHNPGGSSDYVTWIATLHPENADITIDQRFFVPGNPWWTVYEDTKTNEIPLATAEPLPKEKTSIDGNTVTEDYEDSSSKELNKVEAVDESNENASLPPKGPHFCLTCNPFAIFFGLIVAIPTLVFVVTCEMVALCTCHLPATIFYHIAQVFAPPEICTCLLYAVFMIVYGALAFGDSVVLVVSVFATECVGLVALVVGFFTGGCLWAKYLRQQIRKVGHGIRITFRKNSCKPPRRFFFCKTAEEIERSTKPHLQGVKVVRVARVRRAGESCH